MKRSHRAPLPRAIALAAVVTAVAVTAAACGSSGGGGGGGGSASAPGVTSTQITIGSHQPLSGPAAPGYSDIAPASNAYFQYVNAHGGVFGRKIAYKYLDDAYNPAQTSSVVRQLVLQDNVFAMFDGLGTPTHLAAADFINAQKVPDLFIASGCICWNDPQKLPQTFGWQTDYVREGKILGQYVAKNFAGKKVAYFYQNDEFGQDGVKGLDYQIPKSMVVSRQTYQPTQTNIAPAVTAMKTAGAQVVVAYTIPAFTALLKLNSLKLGFNPTMVVSDVGTDPTTLNGLLVAFAKQGGATIPNANLLTNGIITDGYLPAVGDTGNEWIVLFKKIHDQYIPNRPWDGNTLFGEAVGYAFVQALMKAGKNLTRAGLVSAVEKGLPQGPVSAPYLYSSSDHSGISGAYMAELQNGVVKQLGPVQTTDATASGAISTFTGTQSMPPASGIPSP